MLSGNRPLKIVVTGASGFIGSKVLELLNKNTQINLLPVTRQSVPGWCQVIDYAQSPSGDVLIHLAENCDRSEVERLDKEYVESIRASFIELLLKGYRRIVYVSSAVLYGDHNLTPRISSDKVFTSDTYSKVKRQSELLVLKMRGGIVVRPANVYGHGMSKNNVMSKILNQIPGSGPLEVLNSGPIRDFINVNDVAQGIVTLALRGLNIKNSQIGGIYNLGTGIGTSVGGLARLALEVAGQSHREVISKSTIDLHSSLVLDSSQTTRCFGWRPIIKLQQGLCELLQERGR